MRVLFLLVFLGALDGVARADDSRPNILHILTDDMGWTALSGYGNRDLVTPHLDRLASQGMRFTNAYADAQCSPTRAALPTPNSDFDEARWWTSADKQPDGEIRQ